MSDTVDYVSMATWEAISDINQAVILSPSEVMRENVISSSAMRA